MKRPTRSPVLPFALCLALAVPVAALAPTGAAAQARPGPRAIPASPIDEELVQLDFNDVELSVVIDSIAKLTRRNFIYDDRVRGRITIISHERIPVDLAYAMFESSLQMKGFTTLTGPGGAIRIIPIRDAKESSIETLPTDETPPFRDRYITRLIPLEYIDAESITNTLKPLVSKDAAIFAYGPTNSIILTDSSANIRRILDILRLIDVETYKEQQALFKIRHADANALSDMLNEIYGTTTTPRPSTRARRTSRRRTATTATQAVEAADEGMVRIITDERTNSLIVLASRSTIGEIRSLIAKLDVPIQGGGRIHVYYLKNADAEELAQTLNSIITGQPTAQPAGGAQAAQAAQALRAAVTELSEGISVTADPGTNALVIRASTEGFVTLSEVIRQLDIPRPQVLVEALIMEVDVTDSEDLGFSFMVQLLNGNTDLTIDTGTDAAVQTNSARFSTADIDSVMAGMNGMPVIVDGTTFSGLLTAAASNEATNVISAPHILTSDNEEAEIRIGSNIPIITSRVESAATDVDVADLATSVNVERQDVGVTLRVTPQISGEGDTLRLQIFQEITGVIESAPGVDVNEVGPTLTSRRIENTVVVNDSETVVIGGLISDDFDEGENKVPFLGDIPVLGWLFKSTSRSVRKENLLVFLTPHIVRRSEDLERESIRKREEFRQLSSDALSLRETERKEQEQRRKEAEAAGIEAPPRIEGNPVRAQLNDIEGRYPIARLRELAEREAEQRALAEAAAEAALLAPRYAVLAGVFRDEREAAERLLELVDAGFDGGLVSSPVNGSVVFELRLGPYDALEEAEEAAAIVGPAFDLSPSIVIVREEEEP